MELGEFEVSKNTALENKETEKVKLLDRTGEPDKTNFDKFLVDIYKNEVLSKINHEEEEFIEHGVKTLAKELIVLTLSLGQKEVEQETCRFKRAFPSLNVVQCDNSATNNLIEIGSFYEGTLNGFPNEFDFIFVLGTYKNDLPTRSVTRFNDKRYTYQFHFDRIDRDYHIHKVIRVASQLLENRYVAKSYDAADNVQHRENRTTGIRLERKVVFEKRIRVSNSSAKLRFIYINEFGKHRVINVHITPAFKVLESQLSRKTDTRCSSTFAKDEVSKTGSVLVVDGLVWFAQTEVNFMNNVISHKHKNVYRIVKYLVGEKTDIDALRRKFVETGLWRYNMGLMTSYMIKVGVIFHHYDCKHLESEGEAACVLDILNYLKNIKSDKYLKGLTDTVYRPNFFRSVDRYTKLRDMIQLFESMQLSSASYAYENFSVCPINKALLKHFENFQSERSYEKVQIGIPSEELDDETDQGDGRLKCSPAILKFTFGLIVLVVTIVIIVIFTT